VVEVPAHPVPQVALALQVAQVQLVQVADLLLVVLEELVLLQVHQ
jgi:hypothetical protein